jgi:hypothetical protein
VLAHREKLLLKSDQRRELMLKYLEVSHNKRTILGLAP